MGSNLLKDYHMTRENIDRQAETLSVPEAGEILGISRNGAYDAARRGELPVIKIGRKLLVPRIALERMLQDARPTTTAKPNVRTYDR
ncbi:MAG: hypothetical protein BMS9Abin10_0849 [Gammaproteobacteria bacterium]|nr:MAG: hypothetical protein BMS9Abin10_0849 [Gammaproteobacteria bacterium]